MDYVLYANIRLCTQMSGLHETIAQIITVVANLLHNSTVRKEGYTEVVKDYNSIKVYSYHYIKHTQKL